MKSTRFGKGTFIILPNVQIVMRLRGASLNVYIALCTYADQNGRGWPSYNTLADATGYGRRQCIDAMKELLEAGLITKANRSRKDGSNTSNMYELQVVEQEFEEGAEERTLGAPQDTTYGAPQDTSPSAPRTTPMNYTQNELYKMNPNENDAEPAALAGLGPAAEPAQSEVNRALTVFPGATHVGAIRPQDRPDVRGIPSPALNRIREHLKNGGRLQDLKNLPAL